MALLSECHDPGVLLVLSQPKSRQYLEEIHEWYNTEHGPARLQLGEEYFSNGYRYRTSGEDATWLAIYDMRRLSAGADQQYTVLREKRSPREQEIMNNKNNVLSRRFLRLILESEETLTATPAEVICYVSFHASRNDLSGVVDWYKSEICRALQTTHDCKRSRLFDLVDGNGASKNNQLYIGVHDFSTMSSDLRASLSPICINIFRKANNLAIDVEVTVFDFHHEFSAKDYRTPPNVSIGDV